MGATRRPRGATRRGAAQQSHSGGPLSEAEAAAAIAAALSGGASPEEEESDLVAVLLASVVLWWLLRAGKSRQAREIAATAAAFALEGGGPRKSAPASRGQTLASLRRDEPLVRGFYAVNAAKRLSEAYREGGFQKMRQASARERRYLEAHKGGARRRDEAATALEALSAAYGPVLGWIYAHSPREPRWNHVEAHGMNFRADRPPPAKTGAFPAVLPGCGCSAGPPFRGGRMLE